MRFLKIFSAFLFFAFLTSETKATHIKAADLYAKVNPGNLTTSNAHRIIQYTLNVYADKKSVDVAQGSGCDGLGNCAELDFGDGSKSGNLNYFTRTDVGNNTYLLVYYFIHTYPSDGFYEANYIDYNRNAGILNLSAGSSNLAFFIKMGLTIERGLGSNQTPQMSIPPIDLGAMNRIFIHNPGAYDIDGDSISYLPYQPQIGQDITDDKYAEPNIKFGGTTQDGLSPATFSVNSYTGDVIWNAPQTAGLYNIAFIIEEWRIIGKRRERISYSIRDMQINVKDGFNNPPVIKVRKDSCITTNLDFKSSIEVRDPDFDKIVLTPYGELFESNVQGARATVLPAGKNVNTPFGTVFSWTPTCSNVRNRPYQAFFKATDVVATNPLTDIKSFYLTVVGPSPTGLTVMPDTLSTKIRLKWDNYPCTNTARKMEIYRRVGCDTVKIKNCVLGKPNDEYVLIGSVDIGSTTFTDSTAKRGNIYSYSISALFVDNFRKTANSYPSKNKCVELPLIAPIITKVSFEGFSKNQILVKWIKPVDVDTSKVQAPYQYKLFKKISGSSNYKLLQEYPAKNFLYDSSYLDKDIIPATNYVYFVQLTYKTKGAALTLADSSEISTNVALNTTSISRGIRLNWNALTPWQNGVNGLYHTIWRKGQNDLNYIKIDSVTFTQNWTSYSYIDYGSFKNDNNALCDTLNYFVTTSGSYKNPRIKPDTIFNNSFTAKGTVLNDVPPAAPLLKEFSYDCSTFNQVYPFKNSLNWSKVTSSILCFKVVGYKVYFSNKSTDEEMTLLTTTDTTDFPGYIHSNLSSVSGCYAVTAIDNVGNESTKSNKVCLENCFLFELPNVFTPDNSGINDLFRPIPPSPRFVESVKFSVFNRWGLKVFENNNDVYINWDGSGLPDGVYFYTAKVKFTSPDEYSSTKDLKGWIQILR